MLCSLLHKNHSIANVTLILPQPIPIQVPASNGLYDSRWHFVAATLHLGLLGRSCSYGGTRECDPLQGLMLNVIAGGIKLGNTTCGCIVR